WVYEQTGLTGVICLPLHKSGRFVAALAVHQRTPRLWSSGDVELMTTVVARCWESVQRVHAVAAVREGEERYRLIVERAGDAIFVIDADLRYVEVNPAGCALLGFSREELLARTAADLVRPGDGERLAELVARLRAGEGPTEVWELVRADGSTVPVELAGPTTVDAFEAATGRLTGPRGRAETMGLAALITTQLGQTAWMGRRSPLVLATTAGSLAVLVAIVQTPGVSHFFGCTPLDPFAWGAVLASAAVGTAGAEVVPALVGRLRGRSARRPRPPSGGPRVPGHLPG
ncbi:MAG: hypothetical protein AVDCRST_MAG66-250, partial [uncultured Pseudonocardia sp.]